MIRRRGVLSGDGTKTLGSYASKAEAETRLRQVEHSRHATESSTRTSQDLDERPFMVDGVALTEPQIARLSRLVDGTARPGPGQALDLPDAIDIWRRQNHVVTSAIGRQRWQVHSNSPTWRESEEPASPDGAAEAAAEDPAGGPPTSGPLQFRARITEAADATGKLWDVVIIREGWSLNGRYYPRRVLEAAVERRLFEGGKVCDYGIDGDHDHIPLSAREQVPGFVPSRNIVGLLSDVRDTAEGDRYVIAARFTCTHASTQTLLAESWRAGHKDFLGFSIDATGDCQRGTAEGRTGWIVESIDHVFETTLVSDPAAGGRLERLVASTPRRQPMKTAHAKMRSYLSGRLPADKQEGLQTLSGKRLAESFATAVKADLREGDPNDDAQSLLIDVVQTLLKAGSTDIAQMILAKVQANIQSEGQAEGAAEGGEAPLEESDGENVCEECGAENPPDAEQCASCGAPLEGDEMLKETDAKSRTALQKTQKPLPRVMEARMERVDRRLQAMQKALKESRAATNAAHVARCEATMNAMLAGSRLPAKTQEKVRKRFAGQVFSESALREAIEEERTYLAEVGAVNTGEIDNPGQTRASVVREARDKLQMRLDRMLGFTPSEDRDLRVIRESQKNDQPCKLANPKDYEDIRGFRSLREAYLAYTDDDSMSFMYGEGSPMARALKNGNLREATETSFAYALGVSMTRRMIGDYNDYPALWRQVVTIDETVKNFKTQDRILWGGFGNFPVVSESDTGYSYPYLGFPYEAKTQYYIITRGGLVGITRKMILDDDLSALMKLASKLGRGAHLTLERFVFSLLLGNNGGGGVNTDNIYDGKPIYHSAHRNVATDALSYASLVASRQRLREQYDYANPVTLAAAITDTTGTSVSLVADKGSPLGSTCGLQVGDLFIVDSEVFLVTAVAATSGGNQTVTVSRGVGGTTAATHLVSTVGYQFSDAIPLGQINAIVPTNLEATMLSILGSQWIPGSANNDKNFLYDDAVSGRIKPLVVPAQYFQGLQQSFILQASPKDIESVELAFLNNRQDPEILVQDNPTTGYVFTGDVTTYKARHEYAGAVVDFRGLSGNISS